MVTDEMSARKSHQFDGFSFSSTLIASIRMHGWAMSYEVAMDASINKFSPDYDCSSLMSITNLGISS